MKLNKTLIASSVAAVMAAGVMAPAQAEVEVGASVGIASTYLWRGSDLGSGTPAVSGDLNISSSGFYGGIWGSSGDTFAGSEYDLYVGYGGALGDFSYDLSLWNYIYPTGAGYAPGGETDFAEWSDAVVSLGYGPVSFAAYIPVGKENSSGDYMYYTLGADIGSFSVLVGMHSDDVAGGGAVSQCTPEEAAAEESCSPVHLNVSYAYNDNLSFTFSQFIADESDDDDLKFVVSYTLPLGE